MQFPLHFSKHENNGLLVKLKPIPHLNEMRLRSNSKMIKFANQDSGNLQMETKDYIILVAAFALAGYSFYRKYAKKNNNIGKEKSGGIFGKRGGLGDQPDDYEPYSDRKNG
jgi:hypothetical protein